MGCQMMREKTKVKKINSRHSGVRSCLLACLALFLVAWSPGVFAAEPGSPASSREREGQAAGENAGGEFKKYRAVFSELVCGDVKALAVRIAPEESELPTEAIDQRIYLTNKAGDINLVRDSWDYDRGRKGGNINLGGHIYAATSWGCVKDKKGKPYLIVGYWGGGNHIGAAWDEIYDLKGKMVASTYTEQNKDIRRKRHMFNKKVEALGIDFDWRVVRENDIEKTNVR
jgi:hypothetical protein